MSELEKENITKILAEFLKEHCENENAMTFLDSAILLAEEVSDNAISLIKSELKQRQENAVEQEEKGDSI